MTKGAKQHLIFKNCRRLRHTCLRRSSSRVRPADCYIFHIRSGRDNSLSEVSASNGGFGQRRIPPSS
jgi:hypothetical protein